MCQCNSTHYWCDFLDIIVEFINNKVAIFSSALAPPNPCFNYLIYIISRYSYRDYIQYLTQFLGVWPYSALFVIKIIVSTVFYDFIALFTHPRIFSS